jgi:putative photosynthetic complex assembly protein
MNTLVRPARSFPRAPLWGAAGLVCLALVAATAGRLTGMGAAQPLSTPISERSLRFEDSVDGAVLVYDAGAAQTAGGGEPIAVATGQNGFLRGVLRGFARTRRADGVGDEAPFLLTAWADGRLTLQDPATGRRADLEAFGPTNVAVFARFLIPPHSMAARSAPARQAAP